MDEPVRIGRWEERLLPAELGSGDGRRRTPRDWWVDFWCVVVALAIGGVAFAASQNGPSPTDDGVDLLLGFVALVLLGWRRRQPVWLALAAAALTAFSGSAAGPALVLLFNVAVRRPPAVAVAVALASCIPVPVFTFMHPSPDPWYVDVIVGSLITIAAVGWGTFIRARRQLVLSLRERARVAEASQQERLERARLDERARIAREMHDVLAHRLSLLSLHAGALEFRPEASPDDVARAAGVIRTSAHDALDELREVIGLLRHEPEPAELEPPQPTLSELGRLLAESQAAGMRVQAEIMVDGAAEVPGTLGRNAYRIVQEGLTNARKHAPGARVMVRVSGGPGNGLEVEVRNPLPVGIGAGAPVPGAGMGLVGLAERAGLAGGRLESGTTDDGGFALRAWLPWTA
jgi:signal transduction histidine kinase